MEQFSRRIHFFKEFKRIDDKIACLDRIFERRFNVWYFYESFWLTKTVGFQILSKNKEFEILFFGDAHSNSCSCSRLFLAQHSHLRVTRVFTVDIDIRCFSLMLAKVFWSGFFRMLLIKAIFCRYQLRFFF